MVKTIVSISKTHFTLSVMMMLIFGINIVDVFAQGGPAEAVVGGVVVGTVAIVVLVVVTVAVVVVAGYALWRIFKGRRKPRRQEICTLITNGGKIYHGGRFLSECRYICPSGKITSTKFPPSHIERPGDCPPKKIRYF